MSVVKFSILIPVKSINDYVRETVQHIQNLSTNNWEVFVLPNNEELSEWKDERIKVVATGRVGPGAKRDFGADMAVGDILVFLDDDSYPEPNFLKTADNNFKNSDVAALGGPGITPVSDGFWEHVSGAVFLSKLSGGAPERYIPIGNKRYVDDWPSVNLMVRKSVFLAIGGFDTEFWPGEDTKLCLNITKSGLGKILYDPDLVVWHHRRRGLKAHLNQVGAYGLHRGYFAKSYAETSRRFGYFVPSLFVIWMTFLVITALVDSQLKWIFVAGMFVYILCMIKACFDIAKYETKLIALASLTYIFFTHIWYGVNFIRGLFTSKLVSRLR